MKLKKASWFWIGIYMGIYSHYVVFTNDTLSKIIGIGIFTMMACLGMVLLNKRRI